MKRKKTLRVVFRDLVCGDKISKQTSVEKKNKITINFVYNRLGLSGTFCIPLKLIDFRLMYELFIWISCDGN